MRIIIAGGTGSIGRALTRSLLDSGQKVWILTRNLQTAHLISGAEGVAWDGCTSTGWGEIVSQADALVNLAGINLGSGRWTRSQKERILSSRVETGKAMAEAIRQSNPRSKVLFQASAVGFYGTHGSEPVIEGSDPGRGFLAEVCQAWETSSQPVESLGVRRVIIRTGLVLAEEEGALRWMILPFRFFVGGPLGNGNQGLPWIHLADEVAGIRFLLENEKACGAFNFSGPEPLSNADFGHTLAKVMRRPYWLHVPGFALRLLLGELSTLLLDGQFMFPQRLQELGFRFKFDTAEAALRDVLDKE